MFSAVAQILTVTSTEMKIYWGEIFLYCKEGGAYNCVLVSVSSLLSAVQSFDSDSYRAGYCCVTHLRESEVGDYLFILPPRKQQTYL